MPLPQKQNNNIRKSAKELVYDSLREWIIDGTLMPGEKLVDANIAAYFNVSRTPVREAILALANQKLVEILPGKFTMVSYFDIDSIYNLYTAVSCLHADILTLAYPRLTQDTLAKLAAINQKFLELNEKNHYMLFYAIDMEFHQVFFDIADNPYLSEFKETLDIHSLRIENFFFKAAGNIQQSYLGHQKILQCLEKKDLPSAVEAMKKNFMNTADEISKNTALLSSLSGADAKRL